MISIIGKTHVGRRALNEDRFVADAGWGIALVSDGMGGPAAGEVAADIVVTHMVDYLDQALPIAEAVRQTNDAVKQAAEHGQGKPGMGATLVAARFDGHDYELTWIGDSRAYLWHGELRRISRDHSRVEAQLEQGEIDLAEARASGERNIITRAMGLDESAAGPVPVVRSTLCQGQQLLLCSDGITDVLSGADLAAHFAADHAPPAFLDAIIQAALDGGGSDNITAVLVTADDDAPAPDSAPLPPAAAITVPGAQSVYYPPDPENH